MLLGEDANYLGVRIHGAHRRCGRSRALISRKAVGIDARMGDGRGGIDTRIAEDRGREVLTLRTGEAVAARLGATRDLVEDRQVGIFREVGTARTPTDQRPPRGRANDSVVLILTDGRQQQVTGHRTGWLADRDRRGFTLTLGFRLKGDGSNRGLDLEHPEHNKRENTRQQEPGRQAPADLARDEVLGPVLHIRVLHIRAHRGAGCRCTHDAPLLNWPSRRR